MLMTSKNQIYMLIHSYKLQGFTFFVYLHLTVKVCVFKIVRPDFIHVNVLGTSLNATMSDHVL